MSRLASAFEAWGLTEPPPLALETVAVAWAPDASTAAREAAGQGELLVTPLQMVGVAATLGNEGKRPPLHLLASPHAGCDAPQDQTSTPVISPAQAATLREAWPTWGPEIIGQPGDALGGPDRVLSWFLGLNSARIPRYAVAVLIENPTHPDEAAGIGIRLLEKARAP
jgi:cell division protein FtsI/penicillin-binding protein 2